jgi:hypothetical protein
MSSKIEIQKICECCGKEFIAKTTVTRFCGHTCASKSYKERKKANKIGWANQQTNNQKLLTITELNQEALNQKDFLSSNVFTGINVTFYIFALNIIRNEGS